MILKTVFFYSRYLQLGLVICPALIGPSFPSKWESFCRKPHSKTCKNEWKQHAGFPFVLLPFNNDIWMCPIFPVIIFSTFLVIFFILEIPEWLQVYAKASPDLDEYLKVAIIKSVSYSSLYLNCHWISILNSSFNDVIWVVSRPFSYSKKEPGSSVMFIHIYTQSDRTETA